MCGFLEKELFTKRGQLRRKEQVLEPYNVECTAPAPWKWNQNRGQREEPTGNARKITTWRKF